MFLFTLHFYNRVTKCFASDNKKREKILKKEEQVQDEVQRCTRMEGAEEGNSEKKRQRRGDQKTGGRDEED